METNRLETVVSVNKFGEINSCAGGCSNSTMLYNGLPKIQSLLTHSFLYSVNVYIGNLLCITRWVDKPESLSQAQSLLSPGLVPGEGTHTHTQTHTCTHTHMHIRAVPHFSNVLNIFPDLIHLQ